MGVLRSNISCIASFPGLPANMCIYAAESLHMWTIKSGEGETLREMDAGEGGGVARCVCVNIHQSRNETENHTGPYTYFKKLTIALSNDPMI